MALQVLTARGFAFCDSGEPEQPQFGLPEAGRRGKALLLEGVEASSTDNPQQSIGACRPPGGRAGRQEEVIILHQGAR